MNKTIFISIVLLCSWLSQANAQSSLQSYIDTALQNNPGLHAYKYQNEALQQNIKPARSLEDPMLFGGVMNLPINFSFNQDMMTIKQLGIKQNFSVAKKYSLKGTIAQREFEASSFVVQSQQLILIKQVKQQYYDLYAQLRNIETTQKSIEIIKNYIRIANARYSTGLVSQQDVFKAQLELTKLQEELIKLQSKKGHMTATFNTFLNRGMFDSVVIPSEIKFQKVDLTMDSLIMDADNNSPSLAAAKTIAAKDSAAFLLAKTSKIPDFNVSLWYGQRQAVSPSGRKAMDVLGLTLGITLPIYSKNKQNPLISESNITIQESQSRVESIKNETELMVHHAMLDAEESEKLISLYEKQLIPQAEQTVNSGMIGYQENKVDFLTLIDNFLSLYNYRLQYHLAIADYLKAVAELEMLTGQILINN